MPEWLIIVIAVVGGLLGLYLISVIVCLIFSLVFFHKIKSGNDALNVLLNQRHELALKIILLLEESGVSVSVDDKKAVEKLERIENFQALERIDRNDRISTFSHAEADLIISLKAHSEKMNSDVVSKVIRDYKELEDAYRQKSSIYNADIIGYNYWISSLPVKWISKLFKKNKKDLII